MRPYVAFPGQPDGGLNDYLPFFGWCVLFCVQCGNSVQPGVRFCTGCGTPSPEGPKGAFCEQCGAALGPGAKFCTKCGALPGAPSRPKEITPPQLPPLPPPPPAQVPVPVKKSGFPWVVAAAVAFGAIGLVCLAGLFLSIGKGGDGNGDGGGKGVLGKTVPIGDVFTPPGTRTYDPENAVFDKAVSLAKAEQYEESAKLLRRIVQVEPDHFGAHLRLGLVCLRLSLLDEAVAALSRAVQINPSNASARSSLANAFAQKRDFRRAYKAFAAARPYGPDDKGIDKMLDILKGGEHLLLAEECYENNDFAGALVHYRRTAEAEADEKVRSRIAELQRKVPADSGDLKADWMESGTLELPLPPNVRNITLKAILWGEAHVVFADDETDYVLDPQILTATLAQNLAADYPGLTTLVVYRVYDGASCDSYGVDLSRLRGLGRPVGLKDALPAIQVRYDVPEIPYWEN